MAKIEIEFGLNHVIDFIESATACESDQIAAALGIENDVSDLEDEVSDLRDEVEGLNEEIDKLENKLNSYEVWEIKTLYDEMKLKLLKASMEIYSLEELEHRLGKEFDLSVGNKK